jgi:superfamily II DNA/RNA helicase
MRAQLPRTYYPFYARFARPLPIQEMAASPILEGENVLLLAPTAAGKTEAFLVPLLERYFEALKAGRGHLLLVCPTRALVNDAARRLSAPLERCGLKLARRTGDESQDPASIQAALWITTPEGWDSCLCRHARWLAQTLAIVLDEVHLLADSPRGTQVLCLLRRQDCVGKALQQPLAQRIAASATAAQPQELAQLFLGPQARVLSYAQLRPTRLHYHQWFDYPALSSELASLPDARKVLLFASSRNEAEEAAVQLRGRPPFGSGVFVHHASLSRPLRLKAESAFLRQPCALMCSTSTMEVGVDVGDIDWVVLLHPPEDSLSFFQRAGRSGRRSGKAQVLGCFRNPGERQRLRYYLERGLPKLQPPCALHPSVVVQQALSLLWQNPRKQVSVAALQSRLAPPLVADWSEEELEELLSGLSQKNWLERVAGHYTAGSRLERAAKLGHLHANIGSSSQRQVEVRDSFTGRVLGTVDARADGKVPGRVRLAGQTLQLVPGYGQESLKGKALSAESEAKAASFTPGATISLFSSQDLADFLGVGPRCHLGGPQGNLVGHFLGEIWGNILESHLRDCYSGSFFYADAFVVAWQGSFRPEVWSQEALEGAMRKYASGQRRSMNLGRYHADLPKARQRQETQLQLHWDWLCSHWLSAPWKELDSQSAAPLKELLHSRESLHVEGFFPIDPESI